MENELIKADCIEATQFPELAGRYRVYAVPKTVVNEEGFIEGALPEEFYLDAILSNLPPEAGEQSPGTNV